MHTQNDTKAQSAATPPCFRIHSMCFCWCCSLADGCLWFSRRLSRELHVILVVVEIWFAFRFRFSGMCANYGYCVLHYIWRLFILNNSILGGRRRGPPSPKVNFVFTTTNPFLTDSLITAVRHSVWQCCGAKTARGLFVGIHCIRYKSLRVVAKRWTLLICNAINVSGHAANMFFFSSSRSCCLFINLYVYAFDEYSY